MILRWNCHKFRPHLWDYAAGRMTETRREAIAAHLTTCGVCREETQKAACLLLPIAAERQRRLPEIPGVWQAIQHRLDQPASAEKTLLTSPALRPAFALSGAALCGVGAFAFLSVRSAFLLKPPAKTTTRIVTQNQTPVLRRGAGSEGSRTTPAQNRADRTHPAPQTVSVHRETVGADHAARPHSVVSSAAPRIADAIYLNGLDAPTPKFAVAYAQASDLSWDAPPHFRDDFILAEPPRIAGAGSKAQQKQQEAAAMREYERQQAIVDTRLFRKVTLAEKGESIATICAHLQAQTGVKLNGLRDIEDEKLTIFVEKMPARDVMRAISRLLGYKWMRYGEEGAFFYRLTQPMRSRIAEEEMRSQDDNAALLALDETMKQKQAQDEKQKNGAMVVLYDQLTPADRVALRSGAEIALDPDDPQPDRQIAPELQKQMCAGFGEVYIDDQSDNWLSLDARRGVPYSAFSGARVGISYSISRSELGALTLQGTPHFSLWLPKIGKSHLGMYGELPQTLASGKNPSSAKPDNRKANRLLATTIPFTRLVELKPEHVCHTQTTGLEDPLDPKRQAATADDMYLRPETYFRQYVESDDVWEAVHKRTGLPVVADYYTRLYSLESVQLPRLTLFEALCREGDALGVKWQKDGDFLLARSTSYFWDKLKEVPRRQLEHWEQDSQGKDGLPFDDFLEMASCPDAALDSLRVGQGIWTCWGLPEWERVSISQDGRRDTPLAGTNFRALARCLANFSLPLRDSLMQSGGANIRDMPFAAQQELIKTLSAWNGSPERLRDSQIHVDYVPAGRFVWHPAQSSPHLVGISAVQVVSGRTEAEALAAAQKLDPNATKNQIYCSRGVFAVELNQNSPNRQVIGTPLVTLH